MGSSGFNWKLADHPKLPKGKTVGLIVLDGWGEANPDQYNCIHVAETPVMDSFKKTLGAIAGAGVVKGFEKKQYELLGGGANVVNHGYTKGGGLGAEIVGTFVLVYTVFSATDAKRNARDSHVPNVGAGINPAIPITGTGINPARSLGAAIIFNKDRAWDDQWIFWVGPFIGAALAAIYHQIVIRAIPFKSRV